MRKLNIDVEHCGPMITGTWLQQQHYALIHDVEAVTFMIPLPGVKRERVHVHAEGMTLHIVVDTGVHHGPTTMGDFIIEMMCSFDIPSYCSNVVTCRLIDGLMYVRMPRIAPMSIDIEVG